MLLRQAVVVLLLNGGGLWLVCLWVVLGIDLAGREGVRTVCRTVSYVLHVAVVAVLLTWVAHRHLGKKECIRSRFIFSIYTAWCLLFQRQG